MDPSLAVGFFARGRRDVEALILRLKEIEGEEAHPVITVVDGALSESEVADDSLVESFD